MADQKLPIIVVCSEGAKRSQEIIDSELTEFLFFLFLVVMSFQSILLFYDTKFMFKANNLGNFFIFFLCLIDCIKW